MQYDATVLFYFSHLSFYARGKVCPHPVVGLQPGLVPSVRPSLQRCSSTLLLVGQFKKGFSFKKFIFCFRSSLLLVGEFETDFLCFHFCFGYRFQFQFLNFFGVLPLAILGFF
jgi:hypothetical protein